MRSNILTAIKNALKYVKTSKSFDEVDQSLMAVGDSIKTGLQETIKDLLTRLIPLSNDFVQKTESLEVLYRKGPQSTHKMLDGILNGEPTIPDLAKDILKLVSPKFDVNALISEILEKPQRETGHLKERKAQAQTKIIELSQAIEMAISNIDCFVLSAMATIGGGADTLKSLKTGRIIMADINPRAKTLRNAFGIIKSFKTIKDSPDFKAPTINSKNSEGGNDDDDDNDDEDPEEVAQKNEAFFKSIPQLDKNVHLPRKVPNKRQSLGIIVLHPNKPIEYKEVSNTVALKKFIGEQTRNYKQLQSEDHPKFLKVNSRKVVEAMVEDIKRKAAKNGMSKKEMVDEIINNLSSR